MKKSLVGYTGFVGSNLCESTNFEGLYDVKNVQEGYGTEPDILVYSGVPAQKFIANQFPEKDFEVIESAINNIKKINPKKVILISTIDVYNNTIETNEDTIIDMDKLQPYGKNRYYLEKWVKENIEDYLIVHLPGLYGKNLKKNFIYDLINIVPSMINSQKFKEIISNDNYIKKYYDIQENGYYKYNGIASKEDFDKLKEYFLNLGFSALNFTDSRGSYQFYNLAYLWKHIEIALNNNLNILNLATEPVTASELFKYIKGEEFNNILNKEVPNYNFKSKYYELFDGKDGYIFDKKFVLKDIRKFVNKQD